MTYFGRRSFGRLPLRTLTSLPSLSPAQIHHFRCCRKEIILRWEHHAGIYIPAKVSMLLKKL
jgi:hypothetical protein